MKQTKTRKDFYLQEDYDSYRAHHAVVSIVGLLSIPSDLRSKLLKAVDNLQSEAYQAGYANAEFDAEENRD